MNRVGIWGTAQAGKTTFLVMMYHAMLKQHDQWEITPEDEASRLFIERSFEAIFDEHRFPPNTLAPNWYSFRIQSRQDDSVDIQLRFLDAPGEFFEKYYNRSERQTAVPIQSSDKSHTAEDKTQTPQDLFEKLRDSENLMIFIDPDWSQGPMQRRAYDRMLYQLLEDLRADQRHPDSAAQPHQKIALVLTKVDADTQLWNKREIDPDQCWRETDRTAYCRDNCPLYDTLGSQFMVNQMPGLLSSQQVQCFAVSSIGRTEDNHSNVGDENQWRRSSTPPPPTFEAEGFAEQVQKSYPDVDTKLSEALVQFSMQPNSINDVDKLEPYRIMAPLCWIADLAANCRE